MKTTLIFCALFGTVVLGAQTNEKQATVRIKKIEKINGVEKVTDTTFTTTNLSDLKLEDHNVKIINNGDGKTEIEKIVIVDDKVISGNGDNLKIIHGGVSIDEEIKKAMKEAGVDPETKGVKKVVIVHDDESSENGNAEKEITKVVMVKLNITNADEDDRKRLNNQIGNSDEKLNVDKMNLYPNPADGKFNLNFNLKDKADTEITIYNVEGKQIYNEKLPAYTGEYNKSIDISQNNKGVYFIKVEQGKHSMVKKIIME